MAEKVTILMSVYKPNGQYLREQLASLDGQTYGNLELIIRNDCPEEPLDRELIASCVTRFPVTCVEGEENLGYTGAFGCLTGMAEGDYISYCDQDDIWEPEKIEKCMRAIRETGAVAAVCDKSLMTADGRVYVRSNRAASKMKSDHWNTGDDITAQAAFFSYCTGMTLVAERKLAQRFLPLNPKLYHDMQMMLFLSASGKIAYVDEPLVRYRRHGGNASGVLTGVAEKRDYYETRCKPGMELLERYGKLFPDDPRLKDMLACGRARTRGSVWGLWKYRTFLPDLYRYEIALALCPAFLFRMLKNRVISRVNQGENGNAD